MCIYMYIYIDMYIYIYIYICIYASHIYIYICTGIPFIHAQLAQGRLRPGSQLWRIGSCLASAAHSEEYHPVSHRCVIDDCINLTHLPPNSFCEVLSGSVVHAYIYVCVHTCVRTCVRACVRECMHTGDDH